MTKRRLGLLGVAGALLVAGVLLAAFGPGFGELIGFLQFKIAPKSFLKQHVVRLRQGEAEVMLVGTLHGEHLGHRSVGLASFEALIDEYEPARIALEIRPGAPPSIPQLLATPAEACPWCLRRLA